MILIHRYSRMCPAFYLRFVSEQDVISQVGLYLTGLWLPKNSFVNGLIKRKLFELA